jgi:hypothetical protein
MYNSSFYSNFKAGRHFKRLLIYFVLKTIYKLLLLSDKNFTKP